MFSRLIFKGIFLILFTCLVSSCSGMPQKDSSSEEADISASGVDLSVVYQYFKGHKDLTGIDTPEAQLQLLSRDVDEYGLTHYQFIQVVNAVPVWKNLIQVHVRDKAVYRVDGKGMAIPKKLQTSPNLNAEQAEASARKSHEGMMTSELVVLAEPSKTPVLVYAIEVLKGMHRELIFVNAFNGQVEKVFDNTQTLNH